MQHLSPFFHLPANILQHGILTHIFLLLPWDTFDFSYIKAIARLIVLTPIYILLALYLEQLIPSEPGTHNHPLFSLALENILVKNYRSIKGYSR
jgi:hypothetical protein